MKTYFSKKFIHSYQKLTNKNTTLKDKIKKTLTIFKENPNHPSLRLHKLQGKRITDWSISVNNAVRIIFVYVAGGVLFIDVGYHDIY